MKAGGWTRRLGAGDRGRRSPADRAPARPRAGTGTSRTAIELAAMLRATAAMIAVNSTPSIAPAATAADARTKLNSPI